MNGNSWGHEGWSSFFWGSIYGIWVFWDFVESQFSSWVHDRFKRDREWWRGLSRWLDSSNGSLNTRRPCFFVWQVQGMLRKKTFCAFTILITLYLFCGVSDLGLNVSSLGCVWFTTIDPMWVQAGLEQRKSEWPFSGLSDQTNLGLKFMGLFLGLMFVWRVWFYMWCFGFARDWGLGLGLCSLCFESLKVFVFCRSVPFDFTCFILACSWFF